MSDGQLWQLTTSSSLVLTCVRSEQVSQGRPASNNYHPSSSSLAPVMTLRQRMALTLEVFLLDLPVLWRSPSKETGRPISNWVGTGPRALLHTTQSNALAVGARITSWTLTQRVESKRHKMWEEKPRKVPNRAGRTNASCQQLCSPAVKEPLQLGHPSQGWQSWYRGPALLHGAHQACPYLPWCRDFFR